MEVLGVTSHSQSYLQSYIIGRFFSGSRFPCGSWSFTWCQREDHIRPVAFDWNWMFLITKCRKIQGGCESELGLGAGNDKILPRVKFLLFSLFFWNGLGNSVAVLTVSSICQCKVLVKSNSFLYRVETEISYILINILGFIHLVCTYNFP